MQKLSANITIQASPQIVWDAVTNVEKYRAWTKAFHEGSYFEGSWEKGSSIRFLAINAKGEKEGMLSEIAESQYPNFISIKHLGLIQNGVDDTTSNAVKEWAPSLENYTITANENSGSSFVMEMDVIDAYYDMFAELWPKALHLLKEVCEQLYTQPPSITVTTTIAATKEKVWEHYTNPIQVMQWNFASAEWHCPKATNELVVGGNFCYTMAAKDGSMSFDFIGTFTAIETYKTIAITLADGRKMHLEFSESSGQTLIIETFEAEGINSLVLQQMGWQAILNNFKQQVENN